MSLDALFNLASFNTTHIPLEQHGLVYLFIAPTGPQVFHGQRTMSWIPCKGQKSPTQLAVTTYQMNGWMDGALRVQFCTIVNGVRKRSPQPQSSYEGGT